MDIAKKVTIPDVVAMKRDGKRITMMTAYDAAFARLVEAAGIDIILVGDSLGHGRARLPQHSAGHDG